MSDKLLAEWFWTDRWMGSSAFLLPLEPRGLYREMLTQAWRRGARLPVDHVAIQRAVGCTPAEWRRAWPQIEAYWTVDGGYLVNETQRVVYAEAQAAIERASSRGRAGAQAKHKQHLRSAQAPLEDKPPSPITDLSPQERSPVERTRARDGRGLAFAGKVLEVPKFLDEEFVKRLNGQFFDLTAFYTALDQQLTQTGKTWDLRWIRDQFSAESPVPERRHVERTDERQITAEERSKAERWRRNVWENRCKHEPKCESAAFCIALLVKYGREQEHEALSS